MRDKISEDRLNQLHPLVRAKFKAFVEECESTLNITLRVTEGLRTIEYQNSLYAQGRTKPGPIVTNARGGSSYHNYGLAIDVALLINNGTKIDWGFDYRKLRTIYPKYGLQWGLDWDKDGKTRAEGDSASDEPIADAPHYQYTFGNPSNTYYKTLYKRYLEKNFIPGNTYVNI